MISFKIRATRLTDGSYVHDIVVIPSADTPPIGWLVIPALDLDHAKAACEAIADALRDHTITDVAPGWEIQP